VQHSDQLQEFSKKKGKQLKASAAIYFETPQGETIHFQRTISSTGHGDYRIDRIDGTVVQFKVIKSTRCEKNRNEIHAMLCYAMLCYVAIDCLYLFTLTRGFSPFVVWKRLTSIARPQHRNSGKPQSELFFSHNLIAST
jgi:hypothetical protein